MKKSTLVTLRCLGVVAAVFAAGGAFSTFALWTGANDVLAQQANMYPEYLPPFFLHGVILVTLVNGAFVAGLGLSAWQLFRKETRAANLLYAILKLELIYLCAMMLLWSVTGCMPVGIANVSLATTVLLPQMLFGFPVLGLAIIHLLQHAGVLNAVKGGALRSKWLSAWTLLAITIAAVAGGGALRRHFRHAIVFAQVDGPNMFTSSGQLDYRAFRRSNLDYDPMTLFGPIPREDPAFCLNYCYRKALTGEKEEAAKALLLLALHFGRITSSIERGYENFIACSAPTGPSVLMAPLGLSPLLAYWGFVEPYRVPKGRAMQQTLLKPMTVADIDAAFREHMKTHLPPLTQAVARVDLDNLERRAERVFTDCGEDYRWHADAFQRGMGQFRQTIQRYGQSSGPDYTPLFAAEIELLRKAEEIGMGIASIRQDGWSYELRLRALFTNHQALTVAWPGMGEGTEAGDAELTSRLQRVRELFSSQEGQRCVGFDATTSNITTLLPE